MKRHLGLDFPNLPYLIDGDFKLSESKSIMKYFCRKHNPSLLGSEAVTVATADMVSRVHDDLHKKISLHCFSGDRTALMSEVQKSAQQLATFLGEKEFLAGDQVTFVDFSVFEMLDHFSSLTDGQVFKDYPNLEAFYDRVMSLDGVGEFYRADNFCQSKSGFKPWYVKTQ